jgi:hypothetical protein
VDVWDQFQVLYPRQASNVVEETLLMMINRQIEKVTDDAELQTLMNISAEQKKSIQEATGNLQKVQAQIQQYQIEKRKKMVEDKSKQREKVIRLKRNNDAIRASGVLARLDVR